MTVADPSRILISICVPVFNEEANVGPFIERIRPVFDAHADRYDFEILFTDNHSDDATFDTLVKLSNADHRIRVIRFSRNFGFQKSILTNYLNCRGAAAVQIDVDLQDPPELMSEFLELWERGYRVIYGVRRARPDESQLLFGLRKCFYRVIDFLSEDRMPHDAGDFRLIDRCVIEQLRLVSDQQPYLRGLIAAMGFRQTGVVYDRSKRERGSSKFNFARLFGLALDGILHHSIVPLRLATFAGLFISVIAGCAALYYAMARLFLSNDWPPGFASTTILILSATGMNALLLGVMGEYVGRIYRNVKQGPITITEAVVDHHRTVEEVPRSAQTGASLQSSGEVAQAGSQSQAAP
ncbi:MAG: glycosyltransferase family 2 protein [Hyphomicrobium sp.]